MIDMKGWKPADSELPGDFKEVLVAFKIRHPNQERYSEITVGIGCHGNHYGKKNHWIIVEDQVHDYPTNYWEGDFVVLLWRGIPELPKLLFHSE